MSKSKVKTKKVTKAPTKKVDKKSCGCDAAHAILVILFIAFAVWGLKHLVDYALSSSIKPGMCMINRMYAPIKIKSVYNSLGEVTFVDMEVKESSLFGGWYLYEKDYKLQERQLDFVEEHYTEVPCTRYN